MSHDGPHAEPGPPPGPARLRARRFEPRIGHKLAAIALAFLVPLGLAMAYLIGQQTNSVDAARSELRGVQYLRPLSSLTLDLVRFRSLSTDVANGVAVTPQQIASAEAAVDKDFSRLSTADPSLQKQLDSVVTAAGKGELMLSALNAQWKGVKAIGPKAALSTGYSPQLVSNVTSLFPYLGRVSRLNLDPEPTTFYTADALLAEEPELVNQTAHLGDVLTSLPADGQTSLDIIQLTGLLSQQLGRLQDSLSLAFDSVSDSSTNAALQPTLAPLLDQVTVTVQPLISAAKQQFGKAGAPGLTTSSDIRQLTNAAIQSNARLWNALLDQQDRMLSTRIASAEDYNTTLLTVIIVSLALIVALTTLLSRRIAHNLGHVAHAARELSAGRLDRRAQVTSRDEIGMLARTFNTMAEHLEASYTAVEDKVRTRTRTLRLHRGVAAAANRATTWDEALSAGLPLICDHLGWPAAHAYTADPAGEDGTVTLEACPVWYVRNEWPNRLEEVMRESARTQVSPAVVRASASTRPEGPERLPPTALAAELTTYANISGTIACPVVVHGSTAAVVEFFVTGLEPLDEATVNLMEGLFEQLGRVREREIAARALESAAVAAEAASRAKGAFLATMSHEIRTPMNAVMGMIELLLGTPLTADQRELAEIVNTGADDLLVILNGILDFSKIEAGKFEIEQRPIDLRECIESAFGLISLKTREKDTVDLAYVIDPNLPDEIIGDGLRLRQILINLLGNAVKFTDYGEILLTASRGDDTTREKAEAAARTIRDEGDIQRPLIVRFTVRDTGPGIPQERIDQLFQPFEQLDSSTTRRFGGTGLGLAISRRLVEMMGGNIWVESEVGHGSTFHFTISTREVPASLRRSSTRSAGPDHDLRERRMLVVDDNMTNLTIMTRQAETWGMKVRATRSPQEALSWVRGGEPFDVAILDLQMPGMDGVTLARHISRHLDGIPMILLTSTGSPEDLTLFSAHHSKPIKSAQLYASLHRALVPQRTVPAPASPPSPARPAPAPLRILLAEDNTVNQQLALRMLAKIGYEADVVGDGAQALEAVRNHTYDVVLMDVHMPVMNGLEASRAIHREPHAKRPVIVALTASAMPEDREACIAAGMDYYLTKPLSLDALATTLSRLGGAIRRRSH
uniref:Circadian input-output histidine kinase CikA n=1 Tax=Streptomyces sp. NBC_00180 TaxID=2903632 RepID=A0AAU1I922_9ACTN